MERTYAVKEGDIARGWYVVDATGLALGRLASKLSQILKGKHKAIYSPGVDVGDYVVVVNADKIVLTGRKMDQKVYYRHTGYPGGLKETAFREMMVRHPAFAVQHAVKGMLPKNRLGRHMLRKLKVYAGPDHPHQAQKPQPLEL